MGCRSLVLTEMCEKHEQQDDDTLLKSIHGYLESRLLLLSSIQVRLETQRFCLLGSQANALIGVIRGI